MCRSPRNPDPSPNSWSWVSIAGFGPITLADLFFAVLVFKVALTIYSASVQRKIEAKKKEVESRKVTEAQIALKALEAQKAIETQKAIEVPKAAGGIQRIIETQQAIKAQQAIEAQKAVDARRAIEALSWKYLERYTRLCPTPSCSIRIQKDGGCNFMHCVKCGNAFTWY